MKWTLELQEFEFEFKVDHLVRAQIADVLVHKSQDVPSYPKRETTACEEEEDIPNAHTLWFDGAYRRVLQKSSGGIVIKDPGGITVFTRSMTLEEVASNNEAEYLTLMLGLKQCLEFGIARLIVKGDALLVIKQLLGLWQVKKDNLKKWFFDIKKLLRRFDAIQLKHVARELNHEVDGLAKSQLEAVVAPLQVKEALYNGRESLQEITNFLEAGQCPSGKTNMKKKGLVMKARHYKLIGEDLMVQGKDYILRRVPYKEEIGLILKQCHEEAGHQGKEQVVFRILRAGYCWPSMVRDVHYWCSTCHECQAFGNRKLTSEPQKAILSFDTFTKWAVDAVGPLPRSNNGKRHIIVAVDYLTKWVEAKAVKDVTTKRVATFLFDQI